MSSTASHDLSAANVHDALKNKSPPQGKLAQHGMQPSFATELSLDTIEHVRYFVAIMLLVLNASLRLIIMSTAGNLWVRTSEK